MNRDGWDVPQRQSAAGLFVFFARSAIIVLKGAWPVLLIFLFRGKSKDGNEMLYALVGITTLVLIRSLIGFYYFTFHIAGTDLLIKKGLIRKKQISIPLERIQSVHIERTLLHQLLNISRLKIDTAGSDKTEATIDAIAARKAESFKNYLLQHGGNASASPPSPSDAPLPLIRLSNRDLLKLGLSSNHIQTFFIILAFCISLLQNLEEIFGQRVIQLLQQSSAFITIQAVLAIGIIVLIFSVLVSVIRTVIAYFDFELLQTPQGYRIKSGLLNTRQFVVPYRKIQLYSWKANWIRRRIHLFTLEFHQATRDAIGKKQRLKVPVTKQQMITTLLQPYHPDIRGHADSIHTISKVYPYRRTLIPALPVTILTALIFYPWLGKDAFWFGLLLPVWFGQAWYFQKHFRLYLSADALQILQGVWGREVKLMRWFQLQHFEIRQSIYQRQKGLATVILHTAGGSVKLPFITIQLAYAVCDYALYKTESSKEPWM
jgi:putative membrane protein